MKVTIPVCGEFRALELAKCLRTAKDMVDDMIKLYSGFLKRRESCFHEA